MDPEDLKELQQIFASVDTDDPQSLRTWFEHFPEITNKEHAEIAQVGIDTVYRWKHIAQYIQIVIIELDNCLLNQYFPKFPDKWPVPNIEVPDEVTPEWVKKITDDGMSLKMLARIVGFSRYKLRTMLKKVK